MKHLLPTQSKIFLVI